MPSEIKILLMMKTIKEAELLKKIAQLEKRLSEESAKATNALHRQKGAEQLAASLSKKLTNLDKKLIKVEQVLAEKDKRIAEKDRRIAEKDKRIAEKDKRIAEKDKRIAEKDKDLAEKEKALVEKEQLLSLMNKAIKAALPQLQRFAKELNSRMTDDPEWNRVVVDEFIKALQQLNSMRRDCSVLKKRLNRGGEKLSSIADIKDIEKIQEEVKETTSKLIASGAHQVQNANVVNSITVAALEGAKESSAEIEAMRGIINQESSPLLEQRREQESQKQQSIGRQKPDRDDIPEEQIEPAEAPEDFTCPHCGKRGKFHVIEQSQAIQMFTGIEELFKVMKISLLGQTLVECAKCGTVQPIFTAGLMALNPKRELSIDTLTSTVSLMSNGLPLNRITDIFYSQAHLGSSTLGENILQMAEYADPLIKRIEQEAHNADVIIADETPFSVLQEEGRGHQSAKAKETAEKVSSQTYIQAVTSTNATDKRFALYYAMQGRSAQEIAKVLNPFNSKTIMSDGYAAYTGIVRDNKKETKHASCLIHWRRELLKAANLELQVKHAKDTSIEKATALCKEQIEKGEARPILNMTLYALSRIFAEEQSVIRGKNEDYETYLARVKEHREKYCVPLMDRIDELMTVLRDKAKLVPGKTGKYKNSTEDSLYYIPAVVYYLNRREELRYFLTHPSCPLSSNIVEAKIRPLTILRNNINFMQSLKHTKGLCRLLSLMETARLNGIEDPVQWLNKYYYRLARHCQRMQWYDWTRPDAPKRKDPNKKFVKWEYEKYWDSMPIDDLLPWNYKPSED